MTQALTRVPMPSWDELSVGERARMEDIIAAVNSDANTYERDIYDTIYRACRLRSRHRMIKETRKPSTLRSSGDPVTSRGLPPG